MLIGQRVVGYYPYWVQNEYPANNIDLNIVTHVNHAFAWPDENGNILHYNNMLNGSLNQTIHDGGGKILLSIGGWGNDEGFAAVAASSELRTLFISNLIDICDTYGYDGIDMNWEHPFSNEDRQNLNYLMSEMDSIFKTLEDELEITLDLLDDSFEFQLILPGILESNNADSLAGDTLFWSLNLENYLTEDYILTAESGISYPGRQKWGVALFIILGLLFIGIRMRKKRTY